MPWSVFFSSCQTARFVRSIERLQTLQFQDFADDEFLRIVGQHCFNLGNQSSYFVVLQLRRYDILGKIDVQGSISVSDEGLLTLSELLKLKHLDVNRTSVTSEGVVSKC